MLSDAGTYSHSMNGLMDRGDSPLSKTTQVSTDAEGQVDVARVRAACAEAASQGRPVSFM